ncbi:hypothetical protein GCM10011579_084490 [Streptomyces albiflavescens]|uniref:Uncharacterized protein n=1 Tax=Streptomyces albiflavescens TaxID=1623582 RepID=A0A917YFP0_9ACTN|nr:hypothetical protein GCM10011579_084490 [Streptomyces albiflavescens]
MNPGLGADSTEALGGDFSSMPAGMFSAQLAIGEPNTLTLRPRAFRCAAVDRPYGPAPMTTTVLDINSPWRGALE